MVFSLPCAPDLTVLRNHYLLMKMVTMTVRMTMASMKILIRSLGAQITKRMSIQRQIYRGQKCLVTEEKKNVVPLKNLKNLISRHEFQPFSRRPLPSHLRLHPPPDCPLPLMPTSQPKGCIHPHNDNHLRKVFPLHLPLWLLIYPRGTPMIYQVFLFQKWENASKSLTWESTLKLLKTKPLMGVF